MKLKLFLSIVTLLLVAALVIPFMNMRAGAEPPPAATPAVPKAFAERSGPNEEQPDQELLERMQEVKTRLHMAPMMAISEDPGEEEETQELIRSGWIIEATIEEVEAAIKAAASTPSLEDDIAAKVLAHRASCRYYMEAKK